MCAGREVGDHSGFVHIEPTVIVVEHFSLSMEWRGDVSNDFSCINHL